MPVYMEADKYKACVKFRKLITTGDRADIVEFVKFARIQRMEAGFELIRENLTFVDWLDAVEKNPFSRENSNYLREMLHYDVFGELASFLLAFFD